LNHNRFNKIADGHSRRHRSEQQNHMQLISAAINRHIGALSDEQVTTAAFIAVEDLYKTVAYLSYWDNALAQYLQATGEAFFGALANRGYSVHYFIDNTWNSLIGPAHWFKVFFGMASLAYICPQALACRIFETDRPEAEWPALVSKYIVAARAVANRLVDDFHRDARSFVFLDINAEDFSAATKTVGKHGVVHVFRREAPTARVSWRTG
jgi:hypothetical protein